ncbi:hypothetical protein M1P56_35005 (plasmid) [Streptomyces sp. HU2014]|uniref:hypothetical protein n=1 Tax=Streptomyces sp. HU2014 TaxID=2939414 RepID=UPI00200FD035|nr:hypothetical protein [Streptomyces sp. HU2014]UQI49728.1 hypothetical protein M1P56_35005 [Streptomyces sp. HU2014]
MKAAIIGGLASHATLWALIAAHNWAKPDLPVDNFGQGIGQAIFQTAVTGLVGMAPMPFLLWAGMRLLRERGNILLMATGSVIWGFIGGRVAGLEMSFGDSEGWLIFFAVACGLLGLTPRLP